MKEYFLLPLTLLFLACGGATNEESEVPSDSKEEVAIETEEIAEDEDVDLDEINPSDYQPENPDGNWQIDDYAEMFVGAKIYQKSENIPEGEYMSQYYHILDVSGGYAYVTGAYEGWSEYVLWRMNDGYDLLGTMNAGCGPACDYSFKFYKCQGEKIEEMKLTTLFPMAKIDDHAEVMHKKILDKYEFDYPEDKTYIYKFPQKGTSMELDLMVGADEIHVPILKLSWDKERFSIEELYDEVNERTY